MMFKHFNPELKRFNPEIHHSAKIVENGPRLNTIAKWLRGNTPSYVDGEYQIEVVIQKI